MILFIVAAGLGFIVAKLTNPKDPVRDELVGHAKAGNEVIYSVNGEAVLLKLVKGQVMVYTGKLEVGITNVDVVDSGFDH